MKDVSRRRRFRASSCCNDRLARSVTTECHLPLVSPLSSPGRLGAFVRCILGFSIHFPRLLRGLSHVRCRPGSRLPKTLTTSVAMFTIKSYQGTLEDHIALEVMSGGGGPFTPRTCAIANKSGFSLRASLLEFAVGGDAPHLLMSPYYVPL